MSKQNALVKAFVNGFSEAADAFISEVTKAHAGGYEGHLRWLSGCDVRIAGDTLYVISEAWHVFVCKVTNHDRIREIVATVAWVDEQSASLRKAGRGLEVPVLRFSGDGLVCAYVTRGGACTYSREHAVGDYVRRTQEQYGSDWPTEKDFDWLGTLRHPKCVGDNHDRIYARLSRPARGMFLTMLVGVNHGIEVPTPDFGAFASSADMDEFYAGLTGKPSNPRYVAVGSDRKRIQVPDGYRVVYDGVVENDDLMLDPVIGEWGTNVDLVGRPIEDYFCQYEVARKNPVQLS